MHIAPVETKRGPEADGDPPQVCSRIPAGRPDRPRQVAGRPAVEFPGAGRVAERDARPLRAIWLLPAMSGGPNGEREQQQAHAHLLPDSTTLVTSNQCALGTPQAGRLYSFAPPPRLQTLADLRWRKNAGLTCPADEAVSVLMLATTAAGILIDSVAKRAVSPPATCGY